MHMLTASDLDNHHRSATRTIEQRREAEANYRNKRFLGMVSAWLKTPREFGDPQWRFEHTIDGISCEYVGAARELVALNPGVELSGDNHKIILEDIKTKKLHKSVNQLKDMGLNNVEIARYLRSRQPVPKWMSDLVDAYDVIVALKGAPPDESQ